MPDKKQNLQNFNTKITTWMIPDYSESCYYENQINELISEYVDYEIITDEIIENPSITIKLIACHQLKFPPKKQIQKEIEKVGIEDLIEMYDDLYVYEDNGLDPHQYNTLIKIQKPSEQAKYLVENLEITAYHQITDPDYPLHKTINLYDWLQEHRFEHLQEVEEELKHIETDNLDTLENEKNFQYKSGLLPNPKT